MFPYWAQSRHPNGYLDRFTRVCRTHSRDQHATLSLGIDRIYVVRAMRPKTGELPRKLFFSTFVKIPYNSVYTQ